MSRMTARGATLSPRKCGPKNGRWRGGCTLHGQGYPRVSSGPLRNKLIHLIVAEAMLGRPLLKDEQVHHIDRDVLNFHPSNLRVLSKAAHMELHQIEDIPF